MHPLRLFSYWVDEPNATFSFFFSSNVCTRQATLITDRAPFTVWEGNCRRKVATTWHGMPCSCRVAVKRRGSRVGPARMPACRLPGWCEVSRPPAHQKPSYSLRIVLARREIFTMRQCTCHWVWLRSWTVVRCRVRRRSLLLHYNVAPSMCTTIIPTYSYVTIVQISFKSIQVLLR